MGLLFFLAGYEVHVTCLLCFCSRTFILNVLLGCILFLLYLVSYILHISMILIPWWSKAQRNKSSLQDHKSFSILWKYMCMTISLIIFFALLNKTLIGQFHAAPTPYTHQRARAMMRYDNTHTGEWCVYSISHIFILTGLC